MNKLTNLQKGSLSLVLGMLSEDIKVSRYNFPASKNNSVYTLNGDGIEHIINFGSRQNYDEIFRTVLHHLLNERQVKYIPTLTDLEDDKLAIKKFTDVTNSIDINNQESYEKIKLSLDHLVNFINSASFLNEEYTVLDSAIAILARTTLERYENSRISSADLIEIMDVASENRRMRIDTYMGMLGIDFALNKPFSGDVDTLTKEMSRFISLCMMNKDIKTTITMNSKVDNLIELTLFFKKNAKRIKMFIHDKDTIADDFKRFRDQAYNILLTGEDTANMDIQEKEGLILNQMKEKELAYHCLEICQSFISGIKNGKINYGRDQQLLGSILLNLASMQGGFGKVEDLSDINSVTIENLTETFDNNYQSLKDNPILSLEAAHDIQEEFGQAM